MRKKRIFLLILWILSLVGISFYGGEISYGFFALFTLIPLVSWIYILCVFFLFRIYQSTEGRGLTCGRSAGFYFTLQNESPIAFSGIRAVFYSDFSTIDGLDDAAVYELGPHSGIKKKTEIVCRYRGEYEIGIQKVIIEDFLHLFSFTYHNKESFKVFVKPAIVHLERLHTGDTMLSEMRDSFVNRTEPDVTLREYVPGDDPRFINWKVSAGVQKLMLRERIGEEQQGIGILMDSRRYGEKKEEYLPLENKLLEAAIALSLFYNKKNIPVELYCSGNGNERIPVERNNFESFYEKMSSFAFKEENDTASLYAEVLQRGGIFSKRAVFLLLASWDEAGAQFVWRLSKNNIPVMICLVSDEQELPKPGIPRTQICRIATDADLKEVL